MISHADLKKVSFRAVGLDELLCRISCFTDTELRILEAPHNALCSIEYLTRFTNLSQLSIPDNNLVCLNGIQVLVELRALDLSGNQVNRFEELKCLTKLEKLDLSYNAISSFQDLQVLKHGCRSLRELLIQGNPGSTAPDTNFHLLGFGSLLNLSIGASSSSSRLHLICGAPSLEQLDGLPITQAERQSSQSVDPLELYKTTSFDHPQPILPALSSIQQVNDAAAKLESELIESQFVIEALKKDKADYTEFVSENVKKLMDHISKLSHERDSERMRFIAEKSGLERQVRKLSTDLEGVRETLDSSLEKSHTLQKTLEFSCSCLTELEERIDARLVHSQKLDAKIRSLSIHQVSFSRNLRLRDRVNSFLKRTVDDVVAVISASVRERKSSTAQRYQLQTSLEIIAESISICTATICDTKGVWRGSLQNLRKSYKESESARECLTREIDSMRDEYLQSITVVEELMKKKLVKHEQALVKLHLLYESEQREHQETKSKLDEAIIREKTLKESVERLAAENESNEKNIRFQSEQNMNGILLESELRRESLQRKFDIREKDFGDLEESLGKMRTSSKVKDEVIADLSSQVRDLKDQVAGLERDKEDEHNERIESMRNEIRSNLRDMERIKRQLEETEIALQQKDQLVHYVSAEINGIKETYEEKLRSQTETHAIEISKMRQKLTDAVTAIKHLDNQVQEDHKHKQNLQVKLEEALSEKMRFEKLNSQKISQIKCILGESLS